MKSRFEKYLEADARPSRPEEGEPTKVQTFNVTIPNDDNEDTDAIENRAKEEFTAIFSADFGSNRMMSAFIRGLADAADHRVGFEGSSWWKIKREYHGN